MTFQIFIKSRREIRKQRLKCKILFLNKVHDFFSFLRFLEENKLFYSCVTFSSYEKVWVWCKEWLFRFLHSHYKGEGISFVWKVGKLQYVKTWKKSYLNSIFQLNFTKYEKKVIIQNCLLRKDLQVWTAKFFHKMYIFLFNTKNTIKNSKINFLTIICNIRNKAKFGKLFISIMSTNFVWHSFW